jgi:hypothetical protein
VSESPIRRRAARAAGQRRVQTVTMWTTAGSVAAAGVLAAVLAQGTSSAATAPTNQPIDQNQNQNSVNQDNGGSGIGGDQLRAPDDLPGVTDGGRGRHGLSGGS